MKRENLFRINMEKDEMVIDREAFILRRESAPIKAERNELDGKLAKSILKSVFGIQSVATLFFGVFLIAGLCCGLVTLFRYFEIKVLSVLPLCMAFLFLIVSGVFWVLKKMLDKKNEENDPVDAMDDEYDRLNAISKRELKIPSDAKTVKIFGHFYEGDSIPNEPYDVDEVAIFEEDGKLCLHHIGFVIAVPIDSIEAVVKLGDTITFNDWMKDVPHDSDEYLQYHIVKRQVNEYDEEYSMNGYYSIRFTGEGIPFEILVPLYEIGPFLDILKLEVTEE